MKSLDLSWVEKFSSLTLSEDDSTNVIDRQGSEPFQSNSSEGWALHKPKGGAVRFLEKVRQYLTSKFEIGEQFFPGRVANQTPNTRIFLLFVLLEMETGRFVFEHRG